MKEVTMTLRLRNTDGGGRNIHQPSTTGVSKWLTLLGLYITLVCLTFPVTVVHAQCGCGGGHHNHQPEWMKAPPPKPATPEIKQVGVDTKHDVDHHHDHDHHHHGHEERKLGSPSLEQVIDDDDYTTGHDSKHHHDHHHHHSHDHHHHHHDESTTTTTPYEMFWNRFVGQIMETVPWVTLGVLISATLSIVPSSIMSSLLVPSLSSDSSSSSSSSKWNTFLSVIVASIVGLATPLCSCGALPLASSLLHQQSVGLSSVVAFLTSSQSAGFDSVAITWGLLGPQAALARLLGAMILAITTGLAVQGSVSTPTTTRQTSSSSTSQQKNDKNVEIMSFVSMIRSFCWNCVDTAGEVFPSVIFGLAASTVIVQLLPQISMSYAVLTTNATTTDQIINDTADRTTQTVFNEFVIRILVLLSALPLQLCEHSTVTFAAAISTAGGSPGLAFAFLLTAPSTNLASLLLLVDQSTTTTTTSSTNNKHKKPTDDDGRRRNWMVLPRVVTALVGVALILSYIVDIIGMDLLVEREARLGGGGGMMDLPIWYLQYSKYLCFGLATVGIGHRLFHSVMKSSTIKESVDSCSSDGPCCGDSSSSSSALAEKKDQ